MHADPKLAIVTVTYNSVGVLDEFLDSLESQEHRNFVLYSVDNASSDATLKLLRTPRSLQHVIIENSTNRGFAAATNQGIEHALRDGCDWVLLLNNDTVLPPSVLGKLASSAAQLRAKLLSPLVEASTPTGTIWYGGGRLRSALRGYQPTHDGIGLPLERARQEPFEVSFAPACCLLIEPGVFAEVGLLDPAFFVYFEDADLAIRATRAKLRFMVDPSVRILHKASSLTGGSSSDFTLRWMSRNWILLIRRYAPRAALPLAFAYVYAWTIGRWFLRRDSTSAMRKRFAGYRSGFLVSSGRSRSRLGGSTIAVDPNASTPKRNI